MDMSVPYNPDVVNLSLSDPDCINAGDECNAFYAAQNASQAAVSWAYQFEYGHWVTYYYVISMTPSIKSFLRTDESLVTNDHIEAFQDLDGFTLIVIQSLDYCFWPMPSPLSRII